MRYLIFCVTFCLFSCQNPDATPKPAFNLQVKVGPVRLLAQPGAKGKPLADLPALTLVADLHMTSPFVTPLDVNGQQFQTPWCYVETPNGQRGWIYAAALAPKDGNPAAWYLNQQLTAYLGPKLVEQRKTWLLGLDQLQQATQFAQLYQATVHLRDSMVQKLAARIEPNEANFQPDFAWLTPAMPGFVFQWVEGQPYLFIDYKFWGNLAQKTADPSDDQFISCCYQAFPSDSIESFFPSWMIQTGENQACSQLGTGKHLAMFKKLEALHQNPAAHAIFEPAIAQFKSALLRDMLGKNVCYWQPTDKIIRELQEIEQAAFTLLQPRDLLSIKERMPMFQNLALSKIKVNMRNGE
jgi:hypothetical protein